tara:strand:- start:2519 stop:2686 length:168 start_codon:yes stop_codon:yes gene_type:complete
MVQDSLMKQPKRMKIETPIGSIESDSGNHTIDFLSIVLIIVIVLAGKKIIRDWRK